MTINKLNSVLNKPNLNSNLNLNNSYFRSLISIIMYVHVIDCGTEFDLHWVQILLCSGSSWTWCFFKPYLHTH